MNITHMIGPLLLTGLSLPLAVIAQPTFQPRMLPQPGPAGVVAPWLPAAPHSADPGATGSLRTAQDGPTLADWYQSRGRPMLALFFDRRLERMPADWDGTSRLRLGFEAGDGRQTIETRQVTIGLEHKAPVHSVRDRLPVVKLVESALLREMQLARLRLVDPTVTERALTARNRQGDTEFESLKASAGYVLEVELVPVGETVSLIGNLKGLQNGDLVATVRQPVTQDLRDPVAVDTLSKVFVRHLLSIPAPDR